VPKSAENDKKQPKSGHFKRFPGSFQPTVHAERLHKKIKNKKKKKLIWRVTGAPF